LPNGLASVLSGSMDNYVDATKGRERPLEASLDVPGVCDIPLHSDGLPAHGLELGHCDIPGRDSAGPRRKPFAKAMACSAFCMRARMRTHW